MKTFKMIISWYTSKTQNNRNAMLEIRIYLIQWRLHPESFDEIFEPKLEAPPESYWKLRRVNSFFRFKLNFLTWFCSTSKDEITFCVVSNWKPIIVSSSQIIQRYSGADCEILQVLIHLDLSFQKASSGKQPIFLQMNHRNTCHLELRSREKSKLK